MFEAGGSARLCNYVGNNAEIKNYSSRYTCTRQVLYEVHRHFFSMVPLDGMDGPSRILTHTVQVSYPRIDDAVVVGVSTARIMIVSPWPTAYVRLLLTFYFPHYYVIIFGTYRTGQVLVLVV